VYVITKKKQKLGRPGCELDDLSKVNIHLWQHQKD